MARPLKTGIDYFPLDVDFFVDDKVIAIVGEFGIKGEAALIHMLCAIYRNGYYVEWNDRLKSKLDRELPGVKFSLLDEIIDRLVRWDFFDKDLFYSSSILTSRGIQKRYLEAVRKRKINVSSLPYLLQALPDKQVTKATEPIVPKPKPAPMATKVTATIQPQPQPVVISGNKDNEACRLRFFAETNRANIDILMANLSLRPEDYNTVLSVADEAINEWNTSGTIHRDYSDWARHLINLIRTKIQLKRKENTKPKAEKTPTPQDGNYSFNGGFGGQDI